MLWLISFAAFGVCLVCWVAMAWRYLQQFGLYCDRLALLEERLPERGSTWRLEGGANVFEIEQAWRLMQRPYLASDDAPLRAVGEEAWSSSAWALLWAFATILFGLASALLRD